MQCEEEELWLQRAWEEVALCALSPNVVTFSNILTDCL